MSSIFACKYSVCIYLMVCYLWVVLRFMWCTTSLELTFACLQYNILLGICLCTHIYIHIIYLTIFVFDDISHLSRLQWPQIHDLCIKGTVESLGLQGRTLQNACLLRNHYRFSHKNKEEKVVLDVAMSLPSLSKNHDISNTRKVIFTNHIHLSQGVESLQEALG